MSIKIRILAGFLIVFLGAMYVSIDYLVDELRPRYLESVEESMTDTAFLLSSLLEKKVVNGKIRCDDLDPLFRNLHTREFDAKIYSLHKKRVRLDTYVTDSNGIVLYDSSDKSNIGRNFSRWRDVHRTLLGQYGARSTRDKNNKSLTSTLYVAAPVRFEGAIIGSVTVVKPEESVSLFLDLARKRIIKAGLIVCALSIFIAMILSYWITSPITKLTRYINALRESHRVKMPNIGSREMTRLAAAFETLWRDLNAKKYIEQYVQTITHELKSPLTSIRAASELLMEDMSPDNRQRFNASIYRESRRMQEIIDSLLRLSSLESRDTLRDVQSINIAETVNEAIASINPQMTEKKLTLSVNVDPSLRCEGEYFLISHSIINLLSNAVRFSFQGGVITISATTDNGFITLEVIDRGEGIPLYAIDKIFNRFYSTASQKDKSKGSGLGLPFVREAVDMHGGSVNIMNNPDGGVTARINLPVSLKPVAVE